MYVLGPFCSFLFQWNNVSSAGGSEECYNAFGHLTFRVFFLLLRHPLSVGTREGGEADSYCRHNSPFLRRLCRIGVFVPVESTHTLDSPNSEVFQLDLCCKPKFLEKRLQSEMKNQHFSFCYVVMSAKPCLHPKPCFHCCYFIPAKE